MQEVRSLFKSAKRERNALDELDDHIVAIWLRIGRVILGAIAIVSGLFLFLILLAWWFGVLAASPLILVHDDGHWAAANPDLHAWFDHLASGKGLCCSFADGRSIRDVDWGTEAVADGEKTVIRYWVVVDGQKLDVPPDAVVTEPNKFGSAVVWPYLEGGKTAIRCFMPGTLS